MKTSIAKLALGLTLVSMSSMAMAGIANTKHNLGSTRGSNTNPNFTSATTEICVFCHTPHGADSSAAVPLWNRHLSSSSSYTTYSSLGTSTLDSKSTVVGSVSLACLSCHDGTQAMNVVINSQGSGTNGSVGIGSGTGGSGKFGEFTFMSEVSGEMIYLGTDLRNDHPVSIQYAGSLGGTQANDPDFHTATSVSVASGTTVWYIEADGITGSKSKHDLPLYNRVNRAGDSFSNGAAPDRTFDLAGQPLVECATCHDPHTENTTFLRHNSGNNGSATCLTCHNK